MDAVTLINSGNNFIKDIAAGKQISGALTSSGVLYTWGRCGRNSILGYAPLEDDDMNNAQSIPRAVVELKNVITFDFGIDHAAAVTGNGQLHTWGEGKFAQLGLSDLKPRISPTMVTFPDTVSILDVACGARHTVALDNRGEVWGCGDNRHGSLGNVEFDRAGG